MADHVAITIFDDDFSAEASCKSRSGKRVTFNSFLDVVLIPEKNELSKYKPDLWWAKEDFKRFLQRAKDGAMRRSKKTQEQENSSSSRSWQEMRPSVELRDCESAQPIGDASSHGEESEQPVPHIPQSHSSSSEAQPPVVSTDDTLTSVSMASSCFLLPTSSSFYSTSPLLPSSCSTLFPESTWMLPSMHGAGNFFSNCLSFFPTLLDFPLGANSLASSLTSHSSDASGGTSEQQESKYDELDLLNLCVVQRKPQLLAKGGRRRSERGDSGCGFHVTWMDIFAFIGACFTLPLILLNISRLLSEMMLVAPN